MGCNWEKRMTELNLLEGPASEHVVKSNGKRDFTHTHQMSFHLYSD